MADKLLAEWFWTDRWMGSSGFLLPMEARGIYREMLTQSWRRGARLPNDHEAIQRAIGSTAGEWERSWPKIERFWRVEGDYIVNDTQREVYEEARAVADRASQRGLKGAQARAQALLEQSRSKAQVVPEIKPPSPSPSPTNNNGNPPDPPAGAGGDPSSKRAATAAVKRLVERARAGDIGVDLAAVRRMQRELTAGVRSEEEIAASIDAEAAIQAQRREESREQEAAVNWLHDHGGMDRAAAELAAWLSQHQQAGESRLDAGHRWREECEVPPYALAAVFPRVSDAGAIERAHSPPEEARA